MSSLAKFALWAIICYLFKSLIAIAELNAMSEEQIEKEAKKCCKNL